MAENGGPAWKVGELARKTGLTVRALHHYEHIGLLRPAPRTASGHRLYGEQDVRRLYLIVALRDLGLPLEVIRTLLGGGLSLTGLLRDQLDHVDRQIAALRALETRLNVLLTTAESTGDIAPTDLLSLIEGMIAVEDTTRNHFTEEQLAALAERRDQRGEQVVSDEITEWPRLIAQVQAEMDAGTDPADPKVRPLARRWMELLENFHGSDPALRDSLYRMQAQNSQEIQQQYGGPSPEMIDYISRASAAES